MTTWTNVTEDSSQWFDIAIDGYVEDGYVENGYVSGDAPGDPWTPATTTSTTWNNA